VPPPDAARPLVFLSHSGYGGDVEAVLDVLVGRLEDGGFIPLLDRQTIPGGVDFHLRVHNMIATCHAAVVLLNRRAHALESTWVLNETSRLQERAAVDEHFQVVPLYTEGLTPDDFRNDDWEPTDIARLNAAFSAGSPDETATAVVAMLDETRKRMTEGVVEREVLRLLSDVPEGQLRKAAEKLFGGWIAGDPYPAVAKRLVAGGEKYTPVRGFLRELVKFRHFETAQELLTLVLPFMWVRRDAVDPIPGAFAEGRPLGLNSREPRTGKAYVHCASTVWPIWKVCDVGPGFDDDIVGRLERALAGRRRVGLVLLGGDVDWRLVPEEARRRILYLQPELVRKREARALQLMNDEPEDLARYFGAHRDSLGGP
jgi:hypothetical protein